MKLLTRIRRWFFLTDAEIDAVLFEWEIGDILYASARPYSSFTFKGLSHSAVFLVEWRSNMLEVPKRSARKMHNLSLAERRIARHYQESETYRTLLADFQRQVKNISGALKAKESDE